jgi:hypothetical protein
MYCRCASLLLGSGLMKRWPAPALILLEAHYSFRRLGSDLRLQSGQLACSREGTTWEHQAVFALKCCIATLPMRRYPVLNA